MCLRHHFLQVQNRIDDIAMAFERLHAMVTGQDPLATALFFWRCLLLATGEATICSEHCQRIHSYPSSVLMTAASHLPGDLAAGVCMRRTFAQFPLLQVLIAQLLVSVICHNSTPCSYILGAVKEGWHYSGLLLSLFLFILIYSLLLLSLFLFIIHYYSDLLFIILLLALVRMPH